MARRVPDEAVKKIIELAQAGKTIDVIADAMELPAQACISVLTHRKVKYQRRTKVASDWRFPAAYEPSPEEIAKEAARLKTLALERLRDRNTPRDYGHGTDPARGTDY